MKNKNINAAVFCPNPGNLRRQTAGFSLIELLITITLFLIVVGAVFQVMRITLLQGNTISTKIDATKSARIALSYIRRDAINAGLSYHNVGGLTPNGYVNSLVGMAGGTNIDDRDMLTGIICGNGVSTNNLNAAGTKMDSIGFVTRDLTFNNGNFITITGTSASGSDVIVKTPTNQATAAKKYDVYLMITGTSQIVGIVTENPTASSFKLGFGSSIDPLGINQSAAATGNNKSLLVGSNITGSLKKINFVTYGVTANGVLVRTSYGNNTGQPLASQIQTRELIYNVSDFQVKYLLDDGTTTDDPSIGNTSRANQLNMNRVIQMEVTITVMQNTSNLEALAPITIKEVISARNLRYTIN